MSQEVLSSYSNKAVCEAQGCNAKATVSLPVKVGKLGTTRLMLCSNCVIKFNDDDKTIQNERIRWQADDTNSRNILPANDIPDDSDTFTSNLTLNSNPT
jgi:hypothetical protein